MVLLLLLYTVVYAILVPVRILEREVGHAPFGRTSLEDLVVDDSTGDVHHQLPPASPRQQGVDHAHQLNTPTSASRQTFTDD